MGMNYALKTQVLYEILNVDVDLGTAYTAGDPLVAADGVGIAKQDYAATARVTAVVEGIIRGRKVTGALARGDVMGFDNDGNPLGGTAGTGAWTKVHASCDFQQVAVVINAVGATARDVDMWIRPGLGLEDTSSAEIWFETWGSDSTGLGTRGRPFASLTAAVAAVTSTRLNIFTHGGSFAEAAAVVWPTTSGVTLRSLGGNRWQTVISAPGADEVITVAPGAVASTFELTIDGIQIDHDEAGQDGLHLNNTDMTKKLNCYLGTVGMTGDSADYSLKCTHGDTGNAIRIYWDGQNGGCEGAIDLAAANDGDRFYVERVEFNGDIDAGTNIASDIRLKWCQIPYRLFSGGGASTLVALIWCVNDNAGTFSAADDADVTTNSSITGPQIVGT